MNKTCVTCKVEQPISEYAIGKARVRYNSSCRKCRNLVQREKDKGATSRYSQLRILARKRGTYLTITKEQHQELLKLPCAFCQGPLATYGGAMDRIDPDKGYEPGNTVQACTVCNELKGRTFTFEETKIIGRAIREIREARIAAGLPPPLGFAQRMGLKDFKGSAYMKGRKD